MKKIVTGSIAARITPLIQSVMKAAIRTGSDTASMPTIFGGITLM